MYLSAMNDCLLKNCAMVSNCVDDIFSIIRQSEYGTRSTDN